MKQNFFFQVKTQLTAGAGVSRDIAEFLNDKEMWHIAVLVDSGVVEHSSYFGEIKVILEEACRSLEVIELRGSEEPDYDYLDEIVAELRGLDNLDVLIGIGGGSCLDITKAGAALATNPGKGIEYRGFDMVKVPPVPTICIPTTAGTASEVTINAVFTDKSEMKKLGINGRHLEATYAILDAEWTVSCPQMVAVSAGTDALTHTLESFMCNNANPVTRCFSRAAFKLLYDALPSLVDDPDNIEMRQQMLYGSYMAGIGLFNSGSGISGAFSYPIGVHYKVPHGIGGAIFLASVVEYNVAKGYTEYAELVDLVEPGFGGSDSDKSQHFIGMIRDVCQHVGVPDDLSQWGLSLGDLDTVHELLIPLQGAFDQNPIPFYAETDARELLKKHLI
jgi:alcohol dehydrogenase class IV